MFTTVVLLCARVAHAFVGVLSRDVETTDGRALHQGCEVVVTERLPNVRQAAKLTERDIDDVIRAVDVTGGGYVSAHELKAMLSMHRV